MKTKYFLTGFLFLALWLGTSSNLFSTNYANGDIDSPTEKLLTIPGDMASSALEAIALGENKCIDHKWKYTYLSCDEVNGKQVYCFKLVVYNAKGCGKVKVSIGEPDILPGYPAWGYDLLGNLEIKGCFLASTATNPLCVKIDFDNPECCDIEACTKLPDCCEERKWAGEVDCKVIDGMQAYCFTIKVADAKECGLQDIGIDGTPVPGTFNKYYTIDGTLIFEGCVWASSITGTKICFFVDFENSKCCDIRECLAIPPPCCVDHKWKGNVECDEIQGQAVYCYTIKIADVKDCKEPKVSVEGTDVSGPTLAYDIFGNLIITGCVLQSSVTPDSLCFKVDFPKDGCCDFKGCIILPDCCKDRKWDYKIECKIVDGQEVYCYDLTIFDSEACKLIEFTTGGTTVSGPTITYSGGHINITGCVLRSSVGPNNMCFKANFKNPACCYLADCMKLPNCCSQNDWKGEVTCEIIDGQMAWCYYIKIADAKDCGKFKFDTEGTQVPGSPSFGYEPDGTLIIKGCVWASSLSSGADSLCFKIDFENPKCCDFKGCMVLPDPCCEDHKWKGEVKCDIINGVPVYCYNIIVADVEDCKEPTIFVQGTSLAGPDYSYDADGNLHIKGCVTQASFPAGATRLCFGIDFENPACCDFKDCMPLPECCKEKSYGMEQLYCYVKDGKKVYCYLFVVKDAKECEKFVHTTNGQTVDGPSYSYGPSGELYIKHCVTNIEGNELCIKIDWVSDLCCDIKECYKLPTLCLSGALKANDQGSAGVNITAQLEMSVLPIPANDFVNIKVINLEQTAYISVMDINNKQVLKMDLIDQSTTLNTSDLVGGIYFVHLISIDGQRLLTKQISIVH